MGLGRVHCRLAVLYVCTMLGWDMDIDTAASMRAPGFSLLLALVASV